MRLNSDYLFAEDDLGSFIREERDRLIQEVDGYQSQYVLSLETEAVCEELYRKYQHEAPKLKIDRIYIKESGESGKGTVVTFAVPFDGDPDLFRFRPSTFTVNPPCGSVVGNELHLTYTRFDHNHEAMKADLNNDLRNIEQFAGWVAKDVAPYNTGIKQIALQRIESRRQKLQKDQKMIEALGFPKKSNK